MGRSTTDEKAKDTMHITDTTSAIILKTDWPPDGQTSLTMHPTPAFDARSVSNHCPPMIRKTSQNDGEHRLRRNEWRMTATRRLCEHFPECLPYMH